MYQEISFYNLGAINILIYVNTRCNEHCGIIIFMAIKIILEAGEYKFRGVQRAA